MVDEDILSGATRIMGGCDAGGWLLLGKVGNDGNDPGSDRGIVGLGEQAVTAVRGRRTRRFLDVSSAVNNMCEEVDDQVLNGADEVDEVDEVEYCDGGGGGNSNSGSSSRASGSVVRRRRLWGRRGREGLARDVGSWARGLVG